MPRLFVAVEIPTEIKDDLVTLSREVPGARWVPSDQLHLTLRFIGEVTPQAFGAIKGALAGVAFNPFPLTLHGVGHFPPGRHPRVLWVGLEPCESLMRLQQDLERTLAAAGLAPDERPFSPHLTLARLKDTPPAKALFFETRHAELSYPTFQVHEGVLFSSVLTPKGAIHRRELTLNAS